MGRVQIHVDAPSVTQTLGTTLMVHHLSLAAMYFETTSLGTEAAFAEMERQGLNDLAMDAARAFVAVLDGAYETLDKERL